MVDKLHQIVPYKVNLLGALLSPLKGLNFMFLESDNDREDLLFLAVVCTYHGYIKARANAYIQTEGHALT